MRCFCLLLALLAALSLWPRPSHAAEPEPRVLLALGVTFAALIWGLIRALRGQAVTPEGAPKAAPGVASDRVRAS